MAKKKVAAHSHHQHQKDSRDTTTHHPQNHEVNVKPDGPVTVSEPMEKKQDPSEKLQSLKSLNSLLLKETFERRQQVESLEQAKSAMEADLARVGADKRGLETELLVAIQQNVSLELEKAVVCVFLETRLSEVFADFGTLKGHLEVEILGFREKVGELSASLENERAILSQVTRERDSLKSDCGSWMAKANEMRENLNEMDKMRRDLEKRFENLTAEHLKLLEENSEGNRALEVAIQVGDSVRSDLQAAAAEIDALNRKIDELYRENKGMELEKSEREVKIKELEKQIVMLEEDVRSLRKEEKKMQDMVLELGKRLEEASEKEKEMARQIEALVEAGKEKEASIEMVKGEKESLENLLKMARLELEEKEQMMEGIIREKNEIEEANYSSQNEITELQKDMDELRNEVTALQMSFGDATEKNRALVCEINEHKEALDRVLLEKDSVEKLFVEESHQVVSLRSKVGELETKMEEATVALVKLMSDKDELKVQKEESLKRLENLSKEKELLDEKLLDAEQSINKYKSEIEIASVKSCRALSFVRETVSSMVTDSEEKISERGCFVFEEEDVFVKELDRMKKCFQVKESMVDDLLRQIDTMQYSVDKEKKSKHLWSLVSSATTFVAAVLVAYFARK